MTRRLGIALVFLFAVGVVAGAFAQTTGINDEEIQGFVLPATNTKGFRVHANRSHMNLTLAQGNIIARGGYKVPITFAHGSATKASLTNEAMVLAGTGLVSAAAGVSYQRAQYAGSIIGIAIGASTALTAGTATAEATILQADGTTVEATGLSVAIGSPNPTTYNSTTQARDLDRFTSTEGVGCRITTTATLAPVTASIACTVIAEF